MNNPDCHYCDDDDPNEATEIGQLQINGEAVLRPVPVCESCRERIEEIVAEETQ